MTANPPPNIPRLHTPDIIRGIALLGILVVNIQTYTLFAFLKPAQVYSLQLDAPGIYAPVEYLIQVFVKGQFYTIYSFLFGLGFYLMWQKNERLGLNSNRIYKRRLWVLLGFGLLHAFVFWFGDVLHKYALLGFTLLYFNKKSVGVLVKWILAFTLFIILFQIVKAFYFTTDEQTIAASQQQMSTVIARVIDTWQYGSFWSVMSLQKLGVAMLWLMSAQSGFASLAHYEIMFLLGLIAGKLKLFYRVAQLQPRLQFIGWCLLPMALILKAFSAIDVFNSHLLSLSSLPYEKLLLSLAGFIATPLLTIVYLIFLSLYFNQKPNPFWSWIANAGRMGLTNYLAQTLCCMLLFYGYAFGLCGHVTLLQSFVQVGLIYTVQVVFSNLWLKDHTTGPVEKLWKMLVYGKIKKASQQLVHEKQVQTVVY